MFSRVSDASKVAMVTLAHQLLRWGYVTIDCQVLNPHMASLGATEIPRSEFLQLVSENRQHETQRGPWNSMKVNSAKSSFFLTPAHPCSYLEDRSARTLFLDPRDIINSQTYSA